MENVEELTAQRILYFVRLYTEAKNSGSYRTLHEIAEGHGYSPSRMGEILRDAGVELTRGKRPTRLNNVEFRGRVTGKYRRAILTLPKLRALRKRMGLTQASVAHVLGVQKHWISNMENNMLRPTPARIEAYHNALISLHPRKSKAVGAEAAEACRLFDDPDKRDPSGRKSRTGSWGEFVDSLDDGERSALGNAIAYRRSTKNERRVKTRARNLAAKNQPVTPAPAEDTATTRITSWFTSRRKK